MHRFVKRAQINLLELAAVDITCAGGSAASPDAGAACTWCLHLLDSHAVLSVLSKGRCKSPPLLPGPRKVNVGQVAGGLLVMFGFVASDANPADEPSRQP